MTSADWNGQSPIVSREPRILPPSHLPWWCDADAAIEPLRFLAACPNYHATPLVRLEALAARLKLRDVCVKDETSRLGLGSFKALGGAYAVLRVAHRHAEAALGRAVQLPELCSSSLRPLLSRLTFCCASDGNHGRSVAAGARLIGARCVVFLHAGVSEERAQSIRLLGAAVERVDGDYEDSVVHSAREARQSGWTLVADTALDGTDDARVCGYVMQGYTVLVDELLAQAGSDSPFTHVIVQAGVGGLAASVFGHLSARLGENGLPRFVVVEPDRSACLFESAKAGQPVRLTEWQPTVMAMLECQSPSPLAWPIVNALATQFITVTEAEAEAAVRYFDRPDGRDPALRVGESGAAGLAGLLQAANPENRSAFGLSTESRVLLIATESPSDPAAWRQRHRHATER